MKHFFEEGLRHPACLLSVEFCRDSMVYCESLQISSQQCWLHGLCRQAHHFLFALIVEWRKCLCDPCHNSGLAHPRMTSTFIQCDTCDTVLWRHSNKSSDHVPCLAARHRATMVLEIECAFRICSSRRMSFLPLSNG